jgi:ADP-ribosylglycohydrolase
MAVALGLQGAPTPQESMERALRELPNGALWRERLIEAAECEPHRLTPNGWVVTALQAAWRSVQDASLADPFITGVRGAVALGDDTDTIAAIAGALLGAHYGASSIPVEWTAHLGGWPENLAARDLEQLALDLISFSD